MEPFSWNDKVILKLVALATLLCVTGDGAQRNHRIASFRNDKVAQRWHYRYYRIKSLSSLSPNSTFDNVVAARLWLSGAIVRRLRCATPPVMHHVVAARLGKNKNESATDISKQKNKFIDA